MFITKEVDIDIYLDEFDTEELVEELRMRAKSGDKIAAKAFGAIDHDPDQTDFIQSAAEVLSKQAKIHEGLNPHDVIAASGVGSMAVERVINKRS